jgi:hypothetical protein
MRSDTHGRPHDTRNASFASEQAPLLRVLIGEGTSSHDTRNTHRRAVGAKETGEFCGRCGRAISPDETVWRTRERVARGQLLYTNVCRECAPERARQPEPFYSERLRTHLALYDPESCEVCGRPVVWVHYPDWRHYRCCSERCARRRYNRALALASSRARQKVCEVCGSEFVATRSDAKTCSPKCRQAAYRRRRLRQGE